MIPGNNKYKQFIKNIHWTKGRPALKTYINTQYNNKEKTKRKKLSLLILIKYQATSLSKLKNENKYYKISRKILQRAKKSKPGTMTCRLFLKEALLILESGTNCINKRTELMNSCRKVNSS